MLKLPSQLKLGDRSAGEEKKLAFKPKMCNEIKPTQLATEVPEKGPAASIREKVSEPAVVLPLRMFWLKKIEKVPKVTLYSLPI